MALKVRGFWAILAGLAMALMIGQAMACDWPGVLAGALAAAVCVANQRRKA